MVFVEYFVCQIGALAFHLRADAACHGYVACLFPIPSGGNGKDGEQYVDGSDVRSLIDAHTYVPILEITQVHFLAQGDGTYLLCRNGVGQCKAERVEILCIDLLVSQSVDALFQEYGNAVDAFRNGADAFRTVIYGIEACHCSQQCLRGTDVGSRLFTLDMLLAGLQRHAVAQLAVFVFRPADDASRHIALVLVAGGKVGCRRPAVEHRCTEPLCGSEDDVSPPFSRRGEQGEAQNVGGNGHFAVGCMGFFHEGAIIFHVAGGVGILQYAGEDVRCEFHFMVFSYTQLDTLRNGTGSHYCQRLREDGFVNKYHVGARFLHVARTQGIHHRHGFGCGSRFVQQGAVGKGHAGEVAYGSLEVHQGFQASL